MNMNEYVTLFDIKYVYLITLTINQIHQTA